MSGKDDLAAWKQQGPVWLWRYVENFRNFTGWHFTADQEGSRSLLALLDLLEATGDASLYRTVQVAELTPEILAVPNNRSARATSPARWRLRYAQAPEVWTFVEEGDTLVFTVGTQGVRKLRESVEAVLRRDGDFCIGSDPHQLWFWWRRGSP